MNALAFGPALNLSLADVFQSLLVALVLGVVVALVYRVSLAGRVISPAMQGTIVLLAMVAAMVMMVIGNNLARAFSLVGALAIVRFRTRLRSPWDITFIFFALTVGIAAGVFAYRVAFMGTLMISLAVLVMYLLPMGGMRRRIHLLRCDVAAYEQLEDKLAEVMGAFTRKRWLVEARSLRFGETMSYRYKVVFRDDERAQDIVRALSDIEGVERVILASEDEGGES